MPDDCVSKEKFDRCVSDYMRCFRDNNDIELIQREHVNAVRKWSKIHTKKSDNFA